MGRFKLEKIMDKVDIYYFTGTGNSLFVASDIADKINGNIHSIPSIMNKDIIQTDAEIIGILFPVYVGGIPRIIKRFIKKLVNINSKYIFAICTCENTTGTTFKILKKVIRKAGGKLSAGFSVKMPGNFIIDQGAIDIKEQKKLFNDWKNKLFTIIEYIKLKKKGKFEKIADNNDKFGNFFFSFVFINWLLSKMNTSRDKYFYLNDKCNSCGICSRICPVENIKMTEKKPIWVHHCEMCLACLQWCPEEAIQYRIHHPYRKSGDITNNKTENRKRYHHPDVKLKDLILR